MSLQDGQGDVADGRTRNAADVVACARAWLARVELDELVREVPFMDEKRRAMSKLAERLDPQLRREIEGDPSYELWVYGDGRSCRVAAGDDGVACSFLLGQAQIARGASLDDLPAAVAAWLVGRVPLRVLAARAPGIELERYAEVLETDPARWHWLHVRDRIAHPDDVLAPLRVLIEALAESPVVNAFYSYSSLNRLCFSASSHYPWVDDGLPVVTPADDGAYLVGDTHCDLSSALQRIEATLKASPIRPFFGSAPHHELPLLSECLARQGSVLRPQLVQQGAWYRLVVADGSGARRCEVDAQDVRFIGAAGRLSAGWPTLDDAVRVIRRYCAGSASLDEIASDPHAARVWKLGPSSQR